MTLSGMTPAGMRAARLAAGLSMREIARRMGVSAAYLSDLERGNRQLTNKAYAAFWDALAEEEDAPAALDPLTPLREELLRAYELIQTLYLNAKVGPIIAGHIDAWLTRNAGFGPGKGEGK